MPSFAWPTWLTFILALSFSACGADPQGPGPSNPNDPNGPGESDVTPPGPQPEHPSENRPPELRRIGDRVAIVGRWLTIELEAEDPDGDPLIYSVFGAMPEGATLDKTEGRFAWRPETASDPIFLTFIVSDGRDYDRETIRIHVQTDDSNHPPTFVPVSDRVLRPGELSEINLYATDPDGDRLSFGHEGRLPDGASLDVANGVFRWLPPPTPEPSLYRVAFTVTDGVATDRLSLTFVIDDGDTGPRPPTLAPLPSQEISATGALLLPIAAQDPKGLDINLSLIGPRPDGITLHDGVLKWSPGPQDIGMTTQVFVAASNGTLRTVQPVKLSVLSPDAAPRSCSDTERTPNTEISNAAPLGAGEHSLLLCDPDHSSAAAVFSLDLAPGQAIEATLSYATDSHALDLVLLNAEADFLAYSEQQGPDEHLYYLHQGDEPLYLALFATALDHVAIPYTLTLSLSTPADCTDDRYAGNHSPATATPYQMEILDEDLQLCPHAPDFFSFHAGCGAEIYILAQGDGDLDYNLSLFDDANATGAPVDRARSQGSEGELIHTATRTGTWLLEVSGVPRASASGTYQLLIDQSGACQDPAGGPDAAQAEVLGESGLLFNEKLCCEDAWYRWDLNLDDEVIFILEPSQGSMRATVFEPDRRTQLTSSLSSSEETFLSFRASQAGTYYLRVSGTSGGIYDLSWEAYESTGDCGLLSCNLYNNCDTSTGHCVPDPYCTEDSACPPDFVCRDHACVNPCSSAFECRGGYACKTMDGSGQAYCAVKGPRKSGAACGVHSDCEETLACIFRDHGGYCADLECLGCPQGTQCTTHQGQSFCAKTCQGPADCRTLDGFTCSPEKMCLPQ